MVKLLLFGFHKHFSHTAHTKMLSSAIYYRSPLRSLQLSSTPRRFRQLSYELSSSVYLLWSQPLTVFFLPTYISILAGFHLSFCFFLFFPSLFQSPVYSHPLWLMRSRANVYMISFAFLFFSLLFFMIGGFGQRLSVDCAELVTKTRPNKRLA